MQPRQGLDESLVELSADVMDFLSVLSRHWYMGVTPLPRRGAVLPGRDADARMLRVSYHPEVARVVLSIWDHDICMATLRLTPDDVPELVRGLTAALLTPSVSTIDLSTASTVEVALPSPWQRSSAGLPPVPAVEHPDQASA